MYRLVKNCLCSRVPAALVCIVLLMYAVLPATGAGGAAEVYAIDDDEFSGYKAEKLEIEVGYFGGPYYQKASFTVDELWDMDVVYADYTFIDNMPSVIIDHVAGVRASDLMDAAGIDLNSVQSLNFWTNDKTSDYFTSFTKSELIDTPRYCYYSLPENFDSVTGTGNSSADDIAERVDTVIALGDDWNRCIAGAEFGSDYLNLNTNTRFRLIFGQTDTQTRTAGRSAKWIHKIVVVLGGAPTVSVSDSSLEGKVGSILRTDAKIEAADSAVSDAGKITWSSSDDAVASVDEDGNITVNSEGEAVITASFGSAAAKITVNGSAEADESGNGNAAGGIQDFQNSTNENDADNGSDTGNDVDADDSGSYVVPAQVITDTDMGGVQNWRVYEMSDAAQPLADINEDNPMLPVMGAGAGILLIAGIAGRILKYRRDI